MRNLFLVFALGVLTSINAFAQFGIKGGINIATIAEEGQNVSRDDIEHHSVVAPVLGLTFGINLSDIIMIQPELLYSQSGGRNTYTVLGVENTSTYKINYLELPVLAKVKFGNADNKGLGFHIAAGPWIGYAFNGKYKFRSVQGENVLLEVNRDYSFDDEDDTKRLNYGMIGAFGVSMSRTTIDLRYNYGFNNLLDNDADNNNDNKPVQQTRGVALTLGYSF
jgi:Outer membrane protein beta-barrel domain